MLRYFCPFLFSLTIVFLKYTETLAGIYPFPQNVTYPYGQKPANALAGHAYISYANWKEKYYDEMDDNTGRVFFNSADEVVSEGIAYGMLLAAYADDKIVFDRLWLFYKKHSNSNGIMHWKISAEDHVIGRGGATDAEEDAAMALIAAHSQWGEEGNIKYLHDAKKLIDAIMRYEVDPVTFRLKSGDSWGSSLVTNPSYLSPAYYRIFAEITGDLNWYKVLETSYAIIEANAHPVTGLVSDWCLPEGGPAGGNYGYNYTFDASRFPWRMAMDYLWFGETRARDYCVRMSTFVRDQLRGSERVNGSGYTRAGNSLGGGHNSVFVSTFALTGMASGPSFQDHLNKSYTDTYNTETLEYFGATLRVLSLFLLSGNFYRLPEPICAPPDLGEDILLCSMEELTLNAGLDMNENRQFEWSTGHTGNTITINTPGTYTLRVDSAGCIQTDTIHISIFEVALGPDMELTGETVLLSVKPARPEVSYLWSTGETGPEISVNEMGSYWVSGDYEGCIHNDTIDVTLPLPDAYLLYPNPSADGRVQMHIPDTSLTSVRISIYTISGRYIGAFDFQLDRKDRIHTLWLPISGQGVYLIQAIFFTDDKERFKMTKRLVIQ